MVLDIDNTVLMVLIVAGWSGLAMRLPGLLERPHDGRAGAAVRAEPLGQDDDAAGGGVALVFTRLFQRIGWRGALQAIVVCVLGGWSSW